MAQLVRRMMYIAATVLLITSSAICQFSNDLDVDDLEKQLNITGLKNFDPSKIPATEDFEKALKEKCEKNAGGEEAYNAVMSEFAKLQPCIENQVNATQIQAEIEEAKKTGSMDEVFGKYCKQYPQIHACFQAITDEMRPCLQQNEQSTLNQSLQIVEELKEFMCFKDGDRMAMFIAEGGVECLTSKYDELNDCMNKTLGSRVPTDLSVNSLPLFLFSDQECSDFDKIRICVNEALEKCKDSTPANIVDAFFKFLKKRLPCDKQAQAYVKDQPSSSSIAMSSFVIVSVVVSKFL